MQTRVCDKCKCLVEATGYLYDGTCDICGRVHTRVWILDERSVDNG